MDKLQSVRYMASKKGIKTSIFPSSRKDKKYMIFINGKRVHFGQKRYSDFLDTKNKKQRQRFIARFKNHKSYNDKTSGLYYSRKILWDA